MGLTIDDSELEAKLKELSEKFPNKRDKFLAQEGEMLIGRAKKNTPVDTGNLRNAWKRTKATGGKVTVYNNTEYAAHVEYGHRVKVHGKFTGKVVKGRKMLHKAFSETKNNFRDDAQDILEGLF